MQIQYLRETVHQEIKQAITLRFSIYQSNLGLYKIYSLRWIRVNHLLPWTGDTGNGTGRPVACRWVVGGDAQRQTHPQHP